MGNSGSVAKNPSPQGRIVVNVEPSPKECGAVVNTRGYRTSVVEDRDCAAFGITPDKLKDAVEIYHGRRPTLVYIKSPTPWGDLYNTFDDWHPVQETVRPVGAKIVEVKHTLIPIATRRYINNSKETGVFDTSFSETITETSTGTNTANLELNGGIRAQLYVPDDANLGLKANIRNETKNTKTVTVSTESKVNVTLAPGKSVIVHLKSRKTFVRVQVEYEITLDGDVVCRYPDRYKGFHNWALNINSILNGANKHTVFRSYDYFEVTFHTKGEIELENVNESCSSTDEYCMKHGIHDYSCK